MNDSVLNDLDEIEDYNRIICDSKSKAHDIADEIIKLCGTGSILILGESADFLERDLLSRGFSVEVGSFSELFDNKFEDKTFETIVCIGSLVNLSKTDLEKLVRTMHKVATRYFYCRIFSSKDRAYWERFFFQGGFRKHPLLLQFIGYESFEFEGGKLSLIFERIPHEAFEQYTPENLLEERSLHMDMLRESGRRSDAHVARYTQALQFVRPNDVILDVACGLGYGAAVLWDGSLAQKVIGVDNSTYSINYSTKNYTQHREGLLFVQDDAQNLSFIEPESLDLVVSMETVEHLEDPGAFFERITRLLKPGGRIILSVPNEWVDEHGNDPNPYHLQVFNRKSILELAKRYFMVERVFGQIAGGGMKHTDSARAWYNSEDMSDEAEWWIVVGMKNPVVQQPAYKETVLWTEEKRPDNLSRNSYDYNQQYNFPWIQHSLVSIGYRASSEQLIREIIADVLVRADKNTADYGAALCVQGYKMLEKYNCTDPEFKETIQKLKEYVSKNPTTGMELRWNISCLYVLATMYLQSGKQVLAMETYKTCYESNYLKYSPTLATKIVSAGFIVGNLYSIQKDFPEARKWWKRVIAEADKCLKVDINEWIGCIEEPLTFGLKEANMVLDIASQAAYALWLTTKGKFRRPSDYQAINEFSELAQKKWFQKQVELLQNVDKNSQKVGAWASRVEESRIWAQEHIENLEKENEKWKEDSTSLKTWIDELQKSKDWLSDKVDYLENSLKEKEKILLEQIEWTKQLENGKKWIESKLIEYEELLKEKEAEIEKLKNI
ncbi:methyltransferase domain-containing protein [Paenibacillus sp. GCM10023248]|uniref:methyltransferase domain-containing protein n=1 Tax=unclassified Paenibacillus TaxID=185978 RepID=UPI0023798734|nr:methyltransferase domain-containing protein [Paenibacillus sp. MAHUQ-63]MDD9266618.1 methyltransferase domain-containing protein [Paenibacillus sp. MAHUQ-63]